MSTEKAVAKMEEHRAEFQRSSMVPVMFTHELLNDLYVVKGMSSLEISKALACSKRKVLLHLRKFGIGRRSLKDAFSISRSHQKNNPRRGINSPSWKGGRKVDMGYIRLMRPDHHEANADGYVFEHRLIAEQILGRRLRRDEEVHHRNGDRADNRPENLEVMTKSQHMSLHMKEKHKAGKIPHRRQL